MKANPGKVNYGSLSAGTPSHFLGAMFNRATGTDMQHVPYKGSAPVNIDLQGGQIQATFNTTVSMMELYKGRQDQAARRHRLAFAILAGRSDPSRSLR